jgi:DNA-binding Xre family transcriptional regulator
MAVSYDKLWKLLIDKKMNKTQLCEKAKISTNAMARLGKNEDVRVEVLTRICLELGCTMDEIMEIFPEQK